jgi:hypothetical protein
MTGKREAGVFAGRAAAHERTNKPAMTEAADKTPKKVPDPFPPRELKEHLNETK